MGVTLLFDKEKAAHTAAFLLLRNGCSMGGKKLMVLMYLAETKSILERHAILTGGTLVSTEDGPALSECIALFAQGFVDPFWKSFIKNAAHGCIKLADPALKPARLDSLSLDDVELLEEICLKYKDCSEEKTEIISRSCPEWEPPHGLPVPITVEALAQTS